VVRAVRGQVRRVGLASLVLLASVITAALKLPLTVTASLWFAFPILYRAQIFVGIAMHFYSQANSVPMQINFTVHRANEFALLMLGEGVISIITEDLQSSGDFFVTFYLAYFLLSLLALLHYSTTPCNENWHALRRSSLRGIAWDVLNRALGLFLISTAAGFRLVLGNLQAGHAVPRPSAYLLCTSLTICIGIILCTRVTHHGLTEEFFCVHASEVFVKGSLWTGKIVAAGIILVGPLMDAPGWGLLLFCVACLVITLALQIFDQRCFLEHHEQHVTMEVLERELRYATQKGQKQRIAELKKEMAIVKNEAIPELPTEEEVDEAVAMS